jgi:hypothetical protein
VAPGSPNPPAQIGNALATFFEGGRTIIVPVNSEKPVTVSERTARSALESVRNLSVKTAVLHRPPGSWFSSRSVVLPQHLVRSGAQALQGP